MNRGDDPKRRRWFALAATALLAMTAAAAVLDSPPPAPATPPAHETAAPLPPHPSPAARTQRPPPARPLDPEALPPGSAAERRRARAVTRRFAAAFLIYEVGAGPRNAVTRGLRASASPELARELLAQPPRLPARGRPRRGRLLALSGLRVRGAHAWMIARIARGRRRSGLVLELERRRGRFHVARVR